MQQFLDRIAAASLASKVGVLALIIALVGGGYWYFWYDDMSTDEENLAKKLTKLQQEKTDYEKREADYLKFRDEVKSLAEEAQKLVQMLPREDDIEQFIENIQTQVELSGLQKVTSIRDPAQAVDMYQKIPVRMSAVGSFHQINRFFKNVGELKRIVNIEDLTLGPESNNATPLNAPMLLKASFVATTFQLRDGGKSISAQKPPPTTVKAGGEK
jgi:type IV pilus assembly protein PilO